MENLCLKIMNKNMEALAVARGENEVNLVYTGEYQEGDIIILEVSEGSHYAWLQWDDAIGTSMVYLTGNVTYRIPFGAFLLPAISRPMYRKIQFFIRYRWERR